jgi:cytoskeleton protein RodZ
MATVHLVQRADGWPHQTDHDGGISGFGKWLRRTREARGLSLDDISRETKIPLKNLQALELGQMGVQPTFYQRAEVRAVAKAVGVDERLALDRLDSALPPVVPSPTAEVSRPRMKATVSAGAVVVLALGALMLIGAERRAANESFDTTAGRRAPATVAPQPPVAQAATVSAFVSVDASPIVATAAVDVSPVVATAAIDASPVVGTAPVDASPVVDTAAVAASPAPFTELVVRTEPPGAQVTVNGIGWGASPVTIRHLAPGEKHIRATKAGFGAAERLLALDDNQRQTLDLHLTTAP